MALINNSITIRKMKMTKGKGPSKAKAPGKGKVFPLNPLNSLISLKGIAGKTLGKAESLKNMAKIKTKKAKGAK
jgi:hypothetical protein